MYRIQYIQFLVYILFSIFGRANQISDSETYLQILNSIYDSGDIFPNSSQCYNNYINNPGAVNFYLIIWKIVGIKSVRLLFFANALCLFFSNFILSLILKKFTRNKKVELFFWIISSLYLTNLGLVNSISSEVLSYFCLTICLFLLTRPWIIKLKTVKSNLTVFLESSLFGLLIAIFNYIRPTGFIALLSILISIAFYMMIRVKKLNLNIILIAILIFGFYFIGKGTIRQLHKTISGMSIDGSYSLGYNMLIGNGIDSDGSWKSGIFIKGGKGYLVDGYKLTAEEKDRIWTNQAVDSIQSNYRYFAILGVKKLLITYSYDLVGLEKLSYPNVNIFSSLDILNLWEHSTFNVALIVLNNLIYLVLLLGFIFFVWNILKASNNYEMLFLFMIFFVILYSSVIFIVLGGSRYHHAVVPIFLICTCISFLDLFYGRDSKKENSISG